jgi:hypothetical protein
MKTVSTIIKCVVIAFLAMYIIISTTNDDWTQAIFWLLVFFGINNDKKGNRGKE